MIRSTITPRTVIPELVTLSISLFRSDEMNELALFLQNVFDYQLSIERKEVIIRNGVDSDLDYHRDIYSNMISVLDECTVASKQQLINCIPEIVEGDALNLWGYEFLPRSNSECEI